MTMTIDPHREREVLELFDDPRPIYVAVLSDGVNVSLTLPLAAFDAMVAMLATRAPRWYDEVIGYAEEASPPAPLGHESAHRRAARGSAQAAGGGDDARPDRRDASPERSSVHAAVGRTPIPGAERPAPDRRPRRLTPRPAT